MRPRFCFGRADGRGFGRTTGCERDIFHAEQASPKLPQPSSLVQRGSSSAK